MTNTVVLGIEHIVKTPGVVGGAPRIAGRRIPVHHVVYDHLVTGVSVEELVEALDVTPAQIYAALAYYYDHRAEIDRLIEAEIRDEGAHAPDETERVIQAQVQARVSAPDWEMTAPEIAQEYGVSAQAVREACQQGWIPARKSGATWLIRRRDAEERWGKRDSR